MPIISEDDFQLLNRYKGIEFRNMNSNPSAFIIMQIGNIEMDVFYRDTLVPTLIECGYQPKRIDKHNEGGLLKQEITTNISEAELIVADLTNERPNCYLEIGYAMGLDKYKNLILLSREDHNASSPNFKKDGPKVHFDLQGYDILFWNPEKLDEFRNKLKSKINTRKLITIKGQNSITSNEKNNWFLEQNNHAINGLGSANLTAYMEVSLFPFGIRPNILQSDLLKYAKNSVIHTFGWPIGVVFENIKAISPKPREDGIFAEISTKEKTGYVNDGERSTYDYWAFRKDGTYYVLRSLFEDITGTNKQIFFNTRIVQITEALLFGAKLYSQFESFGNNKISIGIKHAGLKDRILSSSTPGRFMQDSNVSFTDSISLHKDISISEIESNLVYIVESFTEPLFQLFNYFKLDKDILKQIVDDFVAGKVT